MDWSSEEGRALLFKAWPDGYLPARGAVTVGRWTCAFADSSDCFEFVKEPDGSLLANAVVVDPSIPSEVASSGALLPLPDPADRATWACLLGDLATALGFPPSPGQGLALVSISHPNGVIWKLLALGIYEYGGPEFSCLGIWGPYSKAYSLDKALVVLRATTRKETGQ